VRIGSDIASITASIMKSGEPRGPVWLIPESDLKTLKRPPMGRAPKPKAVYRYRVLAKTVNAIGFQIVGQLPMADPETGRGRSIGAIGPRSACLSGGLNGGTIYGTMLAPARRYPTLRIEEWIEELEANR